MLEGALEYQDISRTEAWQLAMCKFAQFHIQHEMELLLLLLSKTKGAAILSINKVFADAPATATAPDIAGEESTNNVPPRILPLSSMLSMYIKQTMSVVLEGSIDSLTPMVAYM